MKKIIVGLFITITFGIFIRDLSYIIVLHNLSYDETLNKNIADNHIKLEKLKTEYQDLIQEYEEITNNTNEEIKQDFVYREDIPLNKDIQETIHNECKKYNIKDELIFGLIKHESSFKINAKNSIGCYGLMQLNPKYFPSNLNSIDNVKYGIKYLNDCIIKCKNNIPAALRTYNAGHDDGKRNYSNTVISYARSFGYYD